MAAAREDKGTSTADLIRPALLGPVKPANRFERWVPPLVVWVLAVAVYVPSLNNAYVSWDDDHYIYDNRQLIHPNGLKDIWTNTKYTQFKREGLKHSTHQYYPLLFTIFWVEHQVYHKLHDELLFGVPPERAAELSQRPLAETWRKEFAERHVSLPDRARAYVVEEGRRWLIAEVPASIGQVFYNAKEGYGVRLEDGKLNVYSSDPAIFEYEREAQVMHAVSVALHGVTAVIALLLLQRLGVGVWPAWVVAALFAVHPMNTATVAWASERKNILSLLFYLLALMCYLRYRRRGSRPAYLATFVLFQCALYSKTVALTFPFVLVLTDLLLDRQWRLWRPLLRGVPFLLVAATALVPTWISKHWGWADSLGLLVPIMVVGAVVIALDRFRRRRITSGVFREIVTTFVACLVACAPTLLLGHRYLFSLGAEYQDTLDREVFADALRRRFVDYDEVISGADRAEVAVQETGRRWVVSTSDGQRFTVEREGDKLKVYQGRWYPGGVLWRFAPMFVLVLVLLLLDRAVGGWLDTASLIRIAPLLIMTVLAADTTSYMEDRARTIPLVGEQRPFVAAAALWYYVVKLAVPIGQLPIQPLWNPYPLAPERWQPGTEAFWCLPVLGLVLAAGALLIWRKKVPPHFLWGLGFYGITQLPMIGLQNINIFQFAFVHEHYIYNGCLGVLLLFALPLDALRRRLAVASEDQQPAGRLALPSGEVPWGTLAVTGFVCAVLLGYGVKTALYSRVWKSAETFWLTTLEKNPGCWAGWFNLGNQYVREHTALLEAGKKEEAEKAAEKALEYYKGSVKAKPDLGPGYKQLFMLLNINKRDAELEEYCQRAERYSPYLANKYRAILRARQGDCQAALPFYQEALNRATNQEDRRDAADKAASCLMKLGKWRETIQLYDPILKRQPQGDYQIHLTLGKCSLELDELDAAAEHVRQALEFKPDDPTAKYYVELIKERKRKAGK